MEMFFTDNILYVNIGQRINYSFINKMQRKIYRILDDYAIKDVVLNILSDDYYDANLIDEFICDYKSRYTGKLIVK